MEVVIVDRFVAGDSVRLLAKDYDLPVSRIEAMLRIKLLFGEYICQKP